MAGKSILVVSPDAALRDLVQMHLSDAGYHVTCRRSILTTRRVVREVRPDLLILSLPPRLGHNNWRLVSQLADDPSATVPIMAIIDPVSCHGIAAERLAACRAAILPLVFDLDQLLAAVEAAIGSLSDEDDGRDDVVLERTRRWPRSTNGSDQMRDLTPEEAERLALCLGRRGLPGGALDELDALSDAWRQTLLDTSHGPEDRAELLRLLTLERERLWVERRRELAQVDPNLTRLPLPLMDAENASDDLTVSD